MTSRTALILLLVEIAALDVIFMPRQIWPSDPAAWRQETHSILTYGRLWVNDDVAEGSGEVGQYYTYNPTNGHFYSKFGIVNSIMAIPPMLFQKEPGVLALNIWNIVLCLAAAAALYVLTGRYTTKIWLRHTYVLGVFFGTYVWYYQRAQGGEIYQLLFFLLMCHFLLTALDHPGAVSSRRLWLAWLFLGLLVLTRLLFAILMPVFILVAAWQLWRRRQPFLRSAIVLVLPPVIILGLLGIINNAKFGSPVLSGYHQWRPEDHLLTGSWREGIPGFLFSMHWSIFVYFPVLLLSIWATRPFMRKHPVDAVLIYSSFLITLIILGKIPTWRGEWTYGPRYMLFLLPMLGMPALLLFERWKRAAVIASVCVLLPSIWCQWQVNRAEFWLFYRLTGPAAPLMDSDLTHYVYSRPEAVLYADLYSHQDNLGQSELFKHLSLHAPPRWMAAYRKWVLEVLGQTNLYWWPPPPAV